MMNFKERVLTALALVLFLIVLAILSPAFAQTANQELSFSAVTQFTDNTAITTPVTYIVMKRTTTTATEILRTISNQHSDLVRSVALAPGECVFVIAEVQGVRAVPSPDACIGKIPKSVTRVTIRVSTDPATP